MHSTAEMVHHAPPPTASIAVSAGEAEPQGQTDASLSTVETSAPDLGHNNSVYSVALAGNSLARSNQHAVIVSVDEVEGNQLPTTPDHVADLLGRDLLSGLSLGEHHDEVAVELRIQELDLKMRVRKYVYHIVATCARALLTDKNEESSPRHRRRRGSDVSQSATAVIYGRGLPSLPSPLSVPEPSLITDLGEQISGLHKTRTNSDPTSSDLAPGGLGSQLFRAISRPEPYRNGFLPKGQLQKIINKEAVEKELLKCEASLRRRLQIWNSRPSPSRDELEAEAWKICGRGEQSWPAYSKAESEPGLPPPRTVREEVPEDHGDIAPNRAAIPDLVVDEGRSL
ncbi:hypothetical protein VTI74DRAFT_8612 [Chaetomium olivicolor]